jgi:glycosyltransferase involved in cell wall biosynthesis
MRVVVISHGHPAFTSGGGEQAAFNLYQGINSHPRHTAWLLARAPVQMLHPGTQIAMHNDHEFLFEGEAEVQAFSASMALGPDGEFASLLKKLRPDIIHFHHYYKVGIELLLVARKACPDAAIVLTLHEFMAICQNHGTMVKTSADMRLCHHSSPRACMQCFPQHSAEDFFLREQYIKRCFGAVDLFISPSHFLAGRYQAWGIEGNRLKVIENGILPGGEALPEKRPGKTGRTRFAFFGQVHPYKGLDWLLEALGKLPASVRNRFSLDIHGHGMEVMDKPYRIKLEKLFRKHAGFVRFHGPYDQQELPRLMAETDWVLMASVWWENSPLVIQEAWKYGRPVICPDLGGMAEKVREGKGGYLYRHRDEVALHHLVRRLSTELSEQEYQALVAGLPGYATLETSVKAHLQEFTRLKRSRHNRQKTGQR